MTILRPQDFSVPDFQHLLQGLVAPRPIAFASTVNAQGQVNLSPFSFYNLFSANPPILIFSPARRVRDGSTKDTLNNVLEVPEVTIHVVSHAMVSQMSLASSEYATGVNEFEKAGFTAVPSLEVRPPRVAEAPAAFECKVLEVKPLGQEGGAGNLVICEVLLVHVNPEMMKDGRPDPYKVDAVARLGGDWYCRAQGEALFQLAKPGREVGIGVDQIPASIRHSRVLTGNHLGQLGNVAQLPSAEEVEGYGHEPEVSAILESLSHDHELLVAELHKLAAHYLNQGKVELAWKVLLQVY